MRLLILIVMVNVAFGLHTADQKSDKGQPLSRSKRLIIKKNLWAKGVIPYTFDSSLLKVKGRKTEYLDKVFPVYEKFSCLRFVPWTNSTKEDEGLNHNNYLIFQKTNQCISTVGNTGKNGQKISCCYWKTCLHELAHALGLRHEHTSPMRNTFVRIEHENIVQDAPILAQFGMKDENSVKTFGTYDYDSLMHYGLKAHTRNGKPTITFLDPDTRPVSKFADTERYYYLFMEINAAYGCTAECNKNCVNDGYQAFMNGKCSCRCPEGLDSSSSCKSLKQKDYPCGEIIELTDENPEVTFESPDITGVNKNVTCYWFIKSPKNTRIYLDFPIFDIRKRNDECVDEVAVRPYLLGMNGASYCGDSLPKTIPSERNIMGFSFTQTDGSFSKFKAKATFRSESAYCYDLTNGGIHYNGKVKSTVNWSPCLPWYSVRHCKHSLFNFEDADKNLKKNFCRNPDNSKAPWCYTNAEGCVRNYCDACNYGECKNTVTQCNKKIENDPSYCNKNDDCRKTCENCEDPLPSISATSCGAPVLPPDGKTDSDKEKYSVGETVIITCKSNNDFRKITCLSDGSWTPLNYVCGTCRNGWTNYGSVCYKLFEENKEQQNADQFCRNKCEGCSLLTENKKNHGFIKELIKTNAGGCRQVWTDLTRVDDGKTYTWSNGEEPTWTNWAENKPTGFGCVGINSDCTWIDKGCKLKHKAVCQYPRSVPTKCSDQISECGALVKKDSNFCEDEKKTFALSYCAKTCGLCEK